MQRVHLVVGLIIGFTSLLLGSAQLVSAHVFYVTVTKVKWNSPQQRLDLTVRVFTEDLEQAVTARSGAKLNLWTPGQLAESEQLISAYLLERLKVRVNGQDTRLEFVGMADALDATACFLQIRTIKTVKKIEVENRLLIDLFDEQSNVMQFEVGSEKKFVNLNKRLFRESVSFGG